jgi:SUR7/PalI family
MLSKYPTREPLLTASHQFTAPYNELDTPVSLAYTYHLFPNGVCAEPAGFIDKTVGPFCIYNTPFKRYNLSYVLEKGDVQVKEDMKFSFGNGSFPTETAEKAHLDLFDTSAPTVLYILAALFAFIALITLPKGCCGLKWSFGRKLLNLCITMVAFITIVAASALWTYKASWAMKELAGETNAKYIKDIFIGTSFLAMTWLASIFMLVTVVLLGIELLLDRRQTKSSSGDRRSFVRLSGSEDAADSTLKDGVKLAAWERRPESDTSSGRVEMPRYEPLRA